MEELPLQPNKSVSEAELAAADPEKIGDLLLRYELPVSEPVPAAKAFAERPSGLIISREKLKDRIVRYKVQKFSRNRESASSDKPVEQLTETHFERRHEIQDAPLLDNTDSNNLSALDVKTKNSILPVSSSNQTPPAVPPPFMPEQSAPRQSMQNLQSLKLFKKPLLFGLAGGIFASLMVILLTQG